MEPLDEGRGGDVTFLDSITYGLDHGPILSRIIYGVVLLGIAWMLIGIANRGNH